MARPCQGQCKGERSATDPVAQLVRGHQNQLMVWCMCCDRPLSATGPEEFARYIAIGRLDPSVAVTSAKLFSDDECGYDHVLMKELVAKA